MTWTRALVVGLAATVSARAQSPAPVKGEALRVSLVALDASAAATATTTNARPFTPREGEPCTIQVTLENRSATPLALATLTVTGTGVFSLDHEAVSFGYNGDHVTAEQAEPSGPNVRLRFRYCYAVGGSSTGQLQGVVCGDEGTAYNWVTPGGILMPGRAVSRPFRWIPLHRDGRLSFPVGARVNYVGLGGRPGTGVLVPAEGSQIPPRPAWTYQSPSTDAPMSPESPHFSVWFAPLRDWSETGAPVDAIMPRVSDATVCWAEGANTVVVEPNARPLKSLLPQLGFAPSAVAYAPRAQAWLCAHEGRTAVIHGTKRYEIAQDATEFITARALGGTDGAPWDLTLDDDASAITAHLVGVARDKKAGAQHEVAHVPAEQVLDRLADADRAGLQVTRSGDLFRKATH